MQTSYGRTRAHALGMRAHMPSSYAATASMKHAQHVQTISSRWCKRIIQKHGLGMVPVCGPKNGRASAGRPEDIHCECLGPVPRPCVQKLGFRSGPRCKLCFGVANANVKCMPWCQNAREKKEHVAANSYFEAILSTRFPRAALRFRRAKSSCAVARGTGD